ncbi:MAG: putative histidine kinase [Armatimonadetes bacterium]|jgi:PAS domain S-box-containing protein|nr:putative histidine kinase [Armatimonadota bacterium]
MPTTEAEGKRILVADDSPLAAAVFSRMLRGAGYQVLNAADGIAAAQQAYSERPDLILLDITMPRMNGYQVCRLLKSDPAVAHIPVVILTGSESLATEFWSLHTGADAFLLKAAEPEALLETVQRLVINPWPAATLPAAVTPGPEEILSKVCALMDGELYNSTIDRIQLQTILRNLQDGVLTLDLQHRVTSANRALCQMLGAEEVQVRNQLCRDAIGEAAGADLLELLRQALAGHEGTAQDSVVTNRSGGVTPVAMHLVLLHDHLGATVGGICLFQDITRRKQVEALNEKLRALDRLKEDLTHMIVHDLRTPLTSLLGGLQTIALMGELDTDQDELLQMSVEGGQTLLRMINDLLDTNKMEEGSLALEYAEVNPTELIDRAFRQIASLARDKGLTLASEVPEPCATLLADDDKLIRVLVNLLGNAAKFTPVNGTVTVSVQFPPESTEAVFGVRDTGEGIPREAFDRIFEKFGQVETRKGGRKMSTGLGLTFCRMAVEAHGGRIWVESELGEGSTFFFALPLQPTQRNEAAAATEH